MPKYAKEPGYTFINNKIPQEVTNQFMDEVEGFLKKDNQKKSKDQ